MNSRIFRNKNVIVSIDSASAHFGHIHIPFYNFLYQNVLCERYMNRESEASKKNETRANVMRASVRATDWAKRNS